MPGFNFRLVAALGAALLLGGAALWPSVALASTGGGAAATVEQTTGYGCPTSGSWGWRPVGCGQAFSTGYGSYGMGSSYGYGGYGSYGMGSNYGYSGSASAYSPYYSSSNNYPGSGIAAWAGSNYQNPVGLEWSGYGYPANGYGGPTAVGATPLGYSSGSYPYADSGTPYYAPYSAPNNGGYAVPQLCGYGSSC